MAFSIDWITLSKTADKKGLNEVTSVITAQSEARAAMRSLRILDMPELEVIKADTFYAYGFLVPSLGVRIHIAADLKEQGVKMVFSGDCLRRFNDRFAVLRTAIDAGWRVTRLDVALDLYPNGPKVEDVYKAWMKVHGKDVRKLRDYKRGKTGDTFYINSRSSPKFMRIYDKGGEQGGERNVWTRLELEFKQAAAGALALQVLENINLAAVHMAAILDLPKHKLTKTLKGYAKEAPAIRSRAPRVKRPREVWFMTQVLPAMRNLQEEDYEAFQRCVSEILILAEYRTEAAKAD